jgi:nicotinamidase-related amidase
MTTLENRQNAALLVMDVQNGVVENDQREAVVANSNALVEQARRDEVQVVWIQDSGESRSIGSDAWDIVPELLPNNAEARIDKKYRDSFEDTALESVLRDLRVAKVVVVGAQTDGVSARRSTEHSSGVRTRPSSATPIRAKIAPLGVHRLPTG